MNFLKFYNNIITQHERLIPRINSIANHLIVIYAFALPVLIQVRRASFFLLLILFIFRGHYYYYFKHALKDPLIRAFAIYFIVHIVWLIGNDGSPFTKQIVHDSAFMLYPLLFFTFIDQRYINRILFAFIFGMISSELISYLLSLQLINSSNIDGIRGTLVSPAPVYAHNMYGFMLAIFILSLFILLKNSNLEKYTKYLLSLFLFSSFINIFFAGGRTGPYILCVTVFSYVLLHFRKKSIIPIVSASLFVIASFNLAYNYSPNFNNRVNDILHSIIEIDSQKNYASSLGYRLAIFRNSVEIIKDSWLLGLGTGDHTPAIQESLHKNHPGLQERMLPVQNMHNEYLSAISQFGIIGLLAFINILYQLYNYKSEFFLTKELFPILSIAVFFFTIFEIFTIGLGALLVTIFFVSIGLNNYVTNNASFIKFNGKQLVIYLTVVGFFQAISYI